MEPYSYRADPAVPSFDDSSPIVFMDGECALCTGAARTIARLDRKNEFRICPVQSELGRAVLTHYGLSADDPTTWLYLEDGAPYGSLDGVIRAGERLRGMGRLASLFRVLPRSAQSALYDWIARRRYSLFGKAQMCIAPDEALRRRLLT